MPEAPYYRGHDRSMRHILRSVDWDSEVVAGWKVLSGFDSELTHKCTLSINRLRALLRHVFRAWNGSSRAPS